jgi:hypothetical protein
MFCKSKVRIPFQLVNKTLEQACRLVVHRGSRELKETKKAAEAAL